MYALYHRKNRECLPLPIAGGNYLEVWVIPWIPRVMYLLAEEVILAERGLPELTIQGLDRLPASEASRVSSRAKGDVKRATLWPQSASAARP